MKRKFTLIEIAIILNIIVGLFNVIVASIALMISRFDNMVYSMLLALCNYALASTLAIINLK